MRSQYSQKKIALLIGVDIYLEDESRNIKINDLEGCVNDIKSIQELLGKFEFSDIRILTSPALPPINQNVSNELEERHPTYENIEKEFHNIIKEANAGDLFFFHFSGHGARLRTESKPPSGRTQGPCLLPMDFCRGRKAVYGWKLNEWLKTLNENEVQIVVSLDSCYSADAWRAEGTSRSLKGWSPRGPFIGEAIIEDTSRNPNSRGAKLDISWGIDPKDFVVMAACEGQQHATEKKIDGEIHGIFTHALCTYFKRNQPFKIRPAYRTIRDNIARAMSEQVPRFYGRDELEFLGQWEPPVFITAKIEQDTAILPAGKYHGVEKGAEFKCSSSNAEIITIYEVDDLKSKAKLPPGYATDQAEFSAYRWSSGKTIRVLTQGSRQFCTRLQGHLSERIASRVDVSTSNSLEAASYPKECAFELTKATDGSINISGPSELMGFTGPIRGLEIKGQDDNEQAEKSAIALSHLIRFEQIFDLRNYNPANDVGKFEVNIIMKEQNKFKFTFKNWDDRPLHFAVINLGPGFHINQLYPGEDRMNTVDNGRPTSFNFELKLPDGLHQCQDHRDIIRTVVTKNEKLSFKHWELPDIWGANRMLRPWINNPTRHAFVVDDICWWVQDNISFMHKGISTFKSEPIKPNSLENVTRWN
ncbi:caspase domain-containing protein [Annulohypoxylon moriforme]|nr:caspase domain-containing protein [Annulohypoxylon moriforme]